jgi:hypothetical protein
MAARICFACGICMQMNPRIDAKGLGIPEQKFFAIS